jgi:hypothetical protein
MERYKRIFKEEISKNLKKDVLDRPLEFRYQMLGRFKADADYYFRNPSPKHLWAGDPIEHANNMIAVYNTFSKDEKPEWMTDKELKKYVIKLKS